MAKVKQQKEEDLAELTAKIKEAKSVVFTDEGSLKSEALFRKFFTIGPKA